jgi:hypothetical protein
MTDVDQLIPRLRDRRQTRRLAYSLNNYRGHSGVGVGFRNGTLAKIVCRVPSGIHRSIGTGTETITSVSHIRALEPDDLEQVGELYELTMRTGQRTPPRGLTAYFERTLLDHPWADPEIPSLVFEGSDNRIVGFVGSHVRRLLLDGREIRMGCAGQMVTDPRERHRGIGAWLLRRYLSGPQELTITDGATDVVHQMWSSLGGHALHPGSLVWTRLFRPWRIVGERWLVSRGNDRMRRLVRAGWPLLDTPTARLTRPAARPAGVQTEELTPQAIVRHQDEVLGNARLWANYDERYLEWLFAEMEAVRSRGTFVRRLLRRDDRLLGWYLGYIQPRGTSQVMDVAATRGQLGAVLDCLFADAHEAGADAVEGRLEARLYEPLSRRGCWVHYGARALFHSKDPDVLTAISLGRSALSRLDGEWWMGHHTEPFHERP